MKFSIIIPTYNVAPYIEKCLNSIFIQNFSDYEVIIIDDGSTDGTLEKIKALNYEKAILLENPDTIPLGPGAGRNKGLDIARGEYVLFLDADDWYVDSDCLSYANEKCYGKDIVFFDYINGPHGVFGINWHNFLQSPAVWYKAWRRAFIGDTRFPHIMVAEDLEFMTHMLRKRPSKAIYKKPIVYYNHPREGSLTSAPVRKN